VVAWLCVGMTGLSTSAYAKEQDLPKPVFELIKGQGTEACDAYLQRLNTTEFLDNDPTQGRITEPVQEGFADLKPIPLTAEEIQRLYLKILSFNRYQDQDLIDRFKQVKQDKISDELRDEKLPERIKEFIEQDQKTPFVRFQTLLDMDNDGVVNDTIIQNNNSAYFVDPGLNRIDEPRMKALFGDQEVLDWPTVPQFPPLVHPLHVFNYHGKYYFDGFLDITLLMGSRISPAITPYSPLILSVFIHENFKSKKICEYQWINGKNTYLKTYEYK
jgi:hypothetical protein